MKKHLQNQALLSSNFLIAFFLSLVIFISGCEQQSSSTTSPSTSSSSQTKVSSSNAKPATAKPFDLEKVKQQYANAALTIADISEQNYNNSIALAVTLSIPLNPAQDFQSFFKVSDDKGQPVKGSWLLSDSGTVAYFTNIEPATNYVVDVIGGLTSATGAQLGSASTKQIKTRDMPPQLMFASKGSVLPAKLAKGLPIITTNINAIDIDFHRLKSDKINQFLHEWQDRPGQGYYYYLQNFRPFVELAYSGRFDLNPPKNTRYTTHLDLSDIEALKQPGIYWAVMKEAGNYTENLQVTYFVVSDLGIHARMFADKMVVQVSSLATGKALKGVNLSLIDDKEKELAKTTTDEQGQGQFISPSHTARLLIAKTDDHVSLLQLNSPALDLSEFSVDGRSYSPIDIFMYGPRDLYRPGETVKFSAILRDADANSITAPPLNAVIKRADGQKIKYFTWYPDKAGYYQTEYTLPDTAMAGDWTLEIETAGKHYHDYKFKVEAFLPERMELLLGPQPPQTLWTDGKSNLEIPVSGQYLYGAPASQNRLASKVLIKPNRQPLEKLADYYFGQEDEAPPVKFFDLDDVLLDDQGLTTLDVVSRWDNINHSPFTIKVISSLFETGGRPVTRSVSYTLWPQPTLIGIRPQTDLENIPNDGEVSFDLIKASSDGMMYGDTEVVASLIKERRDYYWEYSESEGWHSEFTQQNYKVFEKRLSLDSKKAVPVTVPVEWGSYLLTIQDTKTGQMSSLRFNAGTGWYYDAQQTDANQSARPDQVVLELDKKYYQAGDKVKLKITPPYTGNGFVVVENSDQQLWFERVSVPAEGMVLEVPVNPDWKRHDLYISSVVFRAGDADEKITPNRAVGIVHLPLDRQARQLQVSIDAPKQAIRPETTLTSTIKVVNAAAGSKTHVTLAAVDVGVLNITEFITPDPFKWFFEPRRYGVDQRDIYGQIIELLEGGVTKPRFGGDADKRAGGARPDTEVQIVSLFSGLVETDAQGQAKIELPIPDFNGRLRLMAVAFNDNQFGSADTEVTVSAPIIAESSLPRFLAAGDTAVMTLDLRNQSGEKQNLSVDVSATQPINLSNGKFDVVLEDKQKQVMRLPISAGSAFDQSLIQLHLHNAAGAKEKIDFRREWRLGVRPAYPATTTVQRKIARDKPVNFSSNLKDLLVSSATAQLSIDTKPPLNLKSHLQSLLQYPYGCLEQTISSTYPWLTVTSENMRDFGLDKMKIHDKLINILNKPSYIDRGISMLAGMQRTNGGFGLWSNNDGEEHWLTGYAVDFLLDAKEQGASVPDEMLNKALNRLTEYLNQRGNMYGENYSQAPEHYSFAYKSYAGYVLSRVNRAPLGSLRTLYDHHRKETKAGLPLVHLGIALINQGDKVLGQQAINEGLAKPRNDMLYLSDYGSRLRDVALITYLLNKHQLARDSDAALLFQLGDELANRDYMSTQELNTLFRLGVLLKGKPQQAWKGNLLLDKVAAKLERSGSYVANFSAEDIPASLEFSAASPEPLYLEYRVQGYPNKAPPMQMDTIKVERNYYNLNGEQVNLQKVKSGDVLVVHLNITASKRLKDALVVDLVPAGFELENQNLENTLKVEEFKIDDTTIADMQYGSELKYQQYLDDRYVAAFDLYENQVNHAFYIIRAVTAGTYTNPPPYAEDMYRPYIRAIGREFPMVEVVN